MTTETIAALEQQLESLRAEAAGLKGRFEKDQERIKAQADYAATLSANNAMLREALENVTNSQDTCSLHKAVIEAKRSLNATPASTASQQEASEWLDKLVMERLQLVGVMDKRNFDWHVENNEETALHFWRGESGEKVNTRGSEPMRLYRLTSCKEGKE